ncbi:MAG: hypothetical protein H0W15_10590 [Gemmatimonadales bacterium]|nr:hypothetical protein [Gemmatimonadales bacterium]
MKKTPKASPARPGRVAEMRAEYDFSGGERGKYAKMFGKGTVMVVLDPDIAEAFPTGVDVNRALRAILDAVPARAPRRRAIKKTP